MNGNEFRILIIDDNPSIHDDFKKILTPTTSSELETLDAKIFGEKNAEVLPHFLLDSALQGIEGIQKILQGLEEGKPYALAFVDVRMPPGLDGIETIQKIWEIDKNIQIVICTAFSDYTWEETVKALGQTDSFLILKKPFDNVAVRQLAAALTKKWQLMQAIQRHTISLEQKVIERTATLQHTESIIKATLESSNDGIILVGNNKEVIEYNNRLIEILEIPPQLLSSNNDSKVMAYLASQVKGNIDVFLKRTQALYEEPDTIGLDILEFKNGKVVERYTQPQKIKDQTVGRIWSYRDISKKTKLEADLQYQAKHDSITGLYNRLFLQDCIQGLIRSTKLDKTNFAVLLIDLDRFKSVNDSFSHFVGDELLQAVTKRLQCLVHANDILGRLGGDEFVMILANISTQEEVLEFANQVLEELSKPYKLANRKLIVTACIGISLFPKDGNDVDTLLRAADAAMNSAKENGFNSFEFYSAQMHKESLLELDKESELRQAIADNEFILYYQPQIDLKTNQIVSVEALVRWQHPQKGLISPSDFIPLTEKTGLILQIGEWVLRTACKQSKSWQECGIPPIVMAVNVTEPQFKEKNFIKKLKNILAENQLQPELLEVELTESVIISTENVIKVIKTLNEMGVKLALDDFGTGYSSLSHLKKVPLNRVKIDQIFVKNIMKNKDDEAIIRAIIAMAKSLGLEVIAEGVERAEQLMFLRKEKCDQVQGFYFSEPLNGELMKELLIKKTIFK